MIIVMSPAATEENLAQVKQKIEQAGLSYHLSMGESRTLVGVIGDKKRIGVLEMNSLGGVEKTVHITEKYKLVSREFHPENTVIDVRGVTVGGESLAIMAGPCAVESREQLYETAAVVRDSGARFMRGGAFKPRTSPYDFQGLAETGLKMLYEVGQEFDLRIVTEIVDVNDVALVAEYADIFQIGARNMQNFRLLQAVGRSDKPVLLKRGLSATIAEWLNAAEYIVNAGNEKVILCERGIRTYETFTRNTLDLSAVAAVKELSHLPVIVDPSHGTGRWQMVQPMARAAIAAGADGLIIEVHPHPEVALSDGNQSLTPKRFQALMGDVAKIAAVMGRK